MSRDVAVFIEGVLFGFCLFYGLWLWKRMRVERAVSRALSEFDKFQKARREIIGDIIGRRGVVLPVTPMTDEEREEWKKVGVTFHGKRLVKTPRRTYSNPAPGGILPRQPTWHESPFTEAELKFLRSLGKKEQQDGSATDKAD